MARAKRQRILLRAHADDPLTIELVGEDVHGEFDRVTDDDKEGVRNTRGALVGDVLEDGTIDDTDVSAAGMLHRHGDAGGDDDDVGIDVEDLWHHFDFDTLIVEGIEQIDTCGE